MKLKSLELQGYKSFANKSIFSFGEGIIAVVGPNGSGKSNIADAIRWVLGEQSYSNLRGQRTSDMIFAGSNNRARMGMAYVSIVLDNSDGSLPLDYNEVTIARRAFRSGENEYLVNNNRVRLKDVAEILAKGGLARQTYTVIGQGTIDKVLSLRAEERRQLFEEAAGITYHRHQRTQTLKRLDETHQNLIRVNDIVKEIEPRLKRLQRQAEKVEKYNTIRLHLDGLLKVWYGYRWGEGQEELHRAKVRQTISEERLKEEQNQLTDLENNIHHLRQQQIALRGELGDWHAESSKLHTRAESIQRELAVGQERSRQLTAQREEFITEIEVLKETQQQQQEQVTEAQQRLAEINQAYQQAENELKTAQNKLDTHKKERQTLIYQQKQATNQTQQLAHAIADAQFRLTQLAEREKELQTYQNEQENTIKQLLEQKETCHQTLQNLQKSMGELETKLHHLENETEQATQTLQNLREQAKTLALQLAEKEKESASLEARQDLLAKLRADMSGYHKGVKAILQNKKLSGIHGTIAQLIKVPTHLENAIETALSSRLQDIVVNSWDNADAAIKYLKKSSSGRATFLPLDRLRPVPRLKIPEADGVLGLATDLVSFDSTITPAIESMMNKLAIVTNLKAAKSTFDILQGSFQIATQAGEIVRSGGAITGGDGKSKQQGGILAREREWRELPALINKAQEQIKALKADLEENTNSQTDSENRLQQLKQQQQQFRQQLTDVQKENNQQTATLSDINNQISWHKNLQIEAEQEVKTNNQREKEIKANIADLNAKKQVADEQVAVLQTKIDNLSSETLLTALNQTKTEVTLIQQQQQSQQALLKSFARSHNQTQSLLDSRQGRVASLGQQREALATRLESQQQEHSTLLDAVKTYTDKIKPAEATLKEIETKQEALEEKESKQRGLRRRLDAEQHRFVLELAHQQELMNALKREIEDDFGMVQLELSADQIGQPTLPLDGIVTELPVVKEIPKGIEEDIRHLKIQLRQLGHVNLDAPREYTELEERYNFLSSQMIDLENAATDLKKVIGELDKMMEEAFSQTYVEVAKAFQYYFKILFSGGEAQLVLTNPDDINKTGVDILARPPGKRSQNLELLSGGERSLTAQALIFALLKTSPTPYCVFDEVDAMLDEANVDRFRQAIATLGKNIQFIIITHNRKTIEIANTIYGVSMGNDAVSRVVSLKIEDIPENGAGIIR